MPPIADENFQEKVATQFGQSASGKNVYGSLYHHQPMFIPEELAGKDMTYQEYTRHYHAD